MTPPRASAPVLLRFRWMYDAGMVARALRVLAIAIAAHGLVVALYAMAIEPLLGENPPEFISSLAFFALFVPASFLVLPIRPLLWNLGLINAPGWFTWPKPLGYVLAYAIWCVGLLTLSLLLSRLSKSRGAISDTEV